MSGVLVVKNSRPYSITKIKRCAWVAEDNLLYQEYHDQEWGVPVHADRLIFEFLILEGMQAGLSWITILKKRPNFRKAFHGFDPQRIAQYTEKDVQRLLADSGIIRNKLKIKAAINNAQCFLKVQEEFGTFDAYIWPFVNGRPKQNRFRTLKQVPATSPESDALSLDLKSRDFKFVGSTICYAHMQATGMVNDHTMDCFRYRDVFADAKT